MEDKYYHITVGEPRPEIKKLGTIERGSGSSVITEKGETLNRRADQWFPNGTKIWAARVIDGILPKDGEPAISVTDPRYKGELKGVEWGKPPGSLIDARYIKGYPSLDVLYQDRILNFKVDESNENSAEVFFLSFPSGDNDIDISISPLLVEHLKWHSYNRDSKCKDPNFATFFFFEKSFDQIERIDSAMFDAKFEAGKIVREAGTGSNSTSQCKTLFSIIKSVTDETPEDNKLYGYLKMLADKKAPEVLKAVADYKLKASNAFVKLESYDAADLTVPGTIVATKPKREIIMTDVPGKGRDMFDYLLENFTDPDVFEATYKIFKITDKITDKSK